MGVFMGTDFEPSNEFAFAVGLCLILLLAIIVTGSIFGFTPVVIGIAVTLGFFTLALFLGPILSVFSENPTNKADTSTNGSNRGAALVNRLSPAGGPLSPVSTAAKHSAIGGETPPEVKPEQKGNTPPLASR